MRGRRHRHMHVHHRGRTTPAHAGKTRWLCTQAQKARDHPRACGEDLDPHRINRGGLGPPPRMRGRPTCPWCTSQCAGTTPAHAGKTFEVVSRSTFMRDHPRACGEDMPTSSRSSMAHGPPPRMRGRRTANCRRRRRPGTTPAHAGKTQNNLRHTSPPPDHPRACGEDGCFECGVSCEGGPPPRMRGRHSLTWSNVPPLAILDTTASAAWQGQKRA